MLRSLALALPLLAAPAFAQDSPVTVTPLAEATTAADGDPLVLPEGPAQATFSLFEIAPGARLPVHQHPYPRLAYILEGRLVVTEDATGEETAYAAGETVVEMVEDWHWGRNDGDGPLRLLVIDLAPPGVSNTILR